MVATVTAYCLSERKKRPMVNSKQIKRSNKKGRRVTMLLGQCKVCGTNMSRILSNEAVTKKTKRK